MGNMLNRVKTPNPVVYKMNGMQDSIFAITGQDMEDVFPQLTDDEYKVDYVSLVPILVKAIKELHTEIETLQSIITSNARMTSASDFATSSRSNNMIETKLLQNRPNPFSERCEIGFTLPEGVTSAFIYIFDMQGKMQKQIPIDNSMNNVVINGYELQPGMYLYSLYVNGREFDTKRMLLSR